MIYKNQELKNAILIVWQVSAVVSILILLVLFFVDEQKILSQLPVCEARKKGLECFLCGSTHAFIELKKLNFGSAFAFNKLSPFMFVLLILNSLFFLKYLFKNYKTKL
ncbi:DUF2752 domain-containing protein [Chryseobacterium sp. FH1]|uniref:DUF2752 domain-containing protein n=1 Tax=Chryseobacterium sp. FH1 TaxID=1233951 RepID=UPI0004E44AF4|nr:hypothetical protein IO90_13515 [Chryseobacterium sp. FH1]